MTTGRSPLIVAPVCLAASLVAAADAPTSKNEATSVTGALADESGVMVQTVCTNCNNADLTLGGLGNDHVPITCDGLPVEPGLAQIYLLSIMPPTLIDRIAVVRGAADPGADGAAVGGGIAIDRRVPRPGLQVNASADGGGYGWAGGRADVSGKAGWFGGTFGATYGRSDTVDSNGDGNVDLPSFHRRTWEAHAEFAPTRRQTLRVGSVDYDESQHDGPSSFDFLSYFLDPTVRYNREDVDLRRREYDVTYEIRGADGSKIAAGGLFADRSEDILENFRWYNPVNIPTYTIRERARAATAAWSKPVGTTWIVSAGASWAPRSYEVVDRLFNLFQMRPPDFTLTEETSERGAWAGFEWTPSASLDLVAGVRWAGFAYADNEYRPAFLALPLPEGDEILPRAALTWKPARSWSLRFSAGLGARQAQPTYDEVCCGRRYRNNRGVVLETSRSFGVEATYRPGPSVRLHLAGFVTGFDDYVVKMISSSFYYRPTYQNTNVPNARFSTIAAEFTWQVHGWFDLRGALSLLDAANRSENGAIPVLVDTGANAVLPYTFTSNTIPYVAQRNAALGVVVRPGRGSTVSATASYTGPLLIQQMTASGTSVVSGTLPDFYRTPPFATLNVRYDQRLPKGLAVYVGVDNATDVVEDTLGNPRFGYTWGVLRGRYVFGGLGFSFGS